MANKTVSDIYGYANDILRQEGSGSGIPGLEEERTIEWVNDLHKQFFEEFTSAGRNFPEYMRREKGYTAVSPTQLAASVAAGATSFTVDSSSALETSGAGVIYKQSQYDIFTHTANSSGTVSGVPSSGSGSLDFAHEEDESVSKLYALPSTFYRLRVEKDRDSRGEGVRVNRVGFYQTPDMPSSRQFSLWQNPSDSSWYLWMPSGQTGDILVTYDAKPTELTTTTGTTGTLDIPSQFSDHWYLVWGLVALFRQVLEEDYVPTKERQLQQEALRKAFTRGTVGRKVTGSNAYFRRYGL